MRHLGLTARMAAVGSVLFGFYAAAAIDGGEPFARGLEEISRSSRRARETAIDSQVNALCISGEQRGIARLFSTHPPVEKRIERLRA